MFRWITMTPITSIRTFCILSFFFFFCQDVERGLRNYKKGNEFWQGYNLLTVASDPAWSPPAPLTPSSAQACTLGIVFILWVSLFWLWLHACHWHVLSHYKAPLTIPWATPSASQSRPWKSLSQALKCMMQWYILRNGAAAVKGVCSPGFWLSMAVTLREVGTDLHPNHIISVWVFALTPP